MQHVNMWGLCIIGILYLTTLTSGEQPKIVIIGAGAAGIAAASKLYENGFQNVTVLEAENRIGGRVNTIWFDESWIDLGGQWVHGQIGNIAFKLAWPLGVLEIPQGMGDMHLDVYNSKGYQVPTFVGTNVMEFFYNISSIDEDVIEANGSIGDYYTRMLNLEFQRYPTVNETLIEQLIHLFERLAIAEEASDNWFEPSVRGRQESWSSGRLDINWKDRGYGTILDILMKKFPNPEEELPVLNNTLLNTEVTNINYHSIEGKASVETSNGEQYVADHVIMTPSLGVLKAQYETLFTPQLPEAKVKTIKGIGFGTAAKIFLSFEEPWWPDDSPFIAFIWDEDDRQEYENDPERKWLVGLIGVFAVAHRPRLLFSWLSGESARSMEKLPEDQVLDQTLAVMNKFLGNTYNITRPTGFIRTKWQSNKHFRGTYSFRSMESERADVWADDLAAPLMVNEKPVVMFAGEATDAHYYSNVHGAINSGFREADRLIKIYRNSTN